MGALSASVIGCHSVCVIESPNNATIADLLLTGPHGRAISALGRSVPDGGRPGRRSPSRLGAENLAQPGSERVRLASSAVLVAGEADVVAGEDDLLTAALGRDGAGSPRRECLP